MYRRGGNNMHFYLLDSAQKFWKELYKKLITMIACVVVWRVELGNRDLCEISQGTSCNISVFEPFEYST